MTQLKHLLLGYMFRDIQKIYMNIRKLHTKQKLDEIAKKNEFIQNERTNREFILLSK